MRIYCIIKTDGDGYNQIDKVSIDINKLEEFKSDIYFSDKECSDVNDFKIYNGNYYTEGYYINGKFIEDSEGISNDICKNYPFGELIETYKNGELVNKFFKIFN